MSAVVPPVDLDQLHGFSISTPTPQVTKEFNESGFPAAGFSHDDDGDAADRSASQWQGSSAYYPW